MLYRGGLLGGQTTSIIFMPIPCNELPLLDPQIHHQPIPNKQPPRIRPGCCTQLSEMTAESGVRERQSATLHTKKTKASLGQQRTGLLLRGGKQLACAEGCM